MKNRRIHYDDNFGFTIFSSILSVAFFLIVANDLAGKFETFLAIMSIFFFISAVVFPKTGFYFNYKIGIIKYFGPYSKGKNRFKMNDIEKIAFLERTASRFTCFPVTAESLGEDLDYVYMNGKIFVFCIHFLDGKVLEFPYTYLYAAISKRRVRRQEQRIRRIVDEFNQYIAEQRANKPAE